MATIISGDSQFQFRALFDRIWCVELTAQDFASVANGAQSAAASITVPGVAFGDMVFPPTASIDWGGAELFAYVSAANTVKLVVQNTSGGAVDLASATFKLLIARPSANLFP